MNKAGRLIPVRSVVDGDWLTWDPFEPGSLVEAERPLADDLDRFAALSRPPRSTAAWRDDIELMAARLGPLGWCSSKDRYKERHRVDWRMSPLRRSGPMRESLADWKETADHINALRRLIHRLRGTAGRPEDWDTVWPDRPGSGLAWGPFRSVGTTPDPQPDGLERASAQWGDVRWERRQIAHHLTSWLSSCHVGPGVQWETDAPTDHPSAGSFLGELGGLLAQSLVDPRSRIRSCEGTVRGQPCRITWAIAHDKPRDAPMRCEGCYALYRQVKAQAAGKETDR